MNTIEHEASLCISLEEFCRFEGLPLRCAMELLHEKITEDQRTWLSQFVVGWDAWEQRARIDALLVEVELEAASADAARIDAAVKRLADATEAFAAERMNRGIRQALSGRSVEEV